MKNENKNQCWKEQRDENCSMGIRTKEAVMKKSGYILVFGNRIDFVANERIEAELAHR